MIMKIGLAAGEIWQFLDKQPDRIAPFSQLVSRLGIPRDLLLMSVGWLAREGYVILRPEGKDYFVSLRNPQSPESK